MVTKACYNVRLISHQVCVKKCPDHFFTWQQQDAQEKISHSFRKERDQMICTYDTNPVNSTKVLSLRVNGAVFFFDMNLLLVLCIILDRFLWAFMGCLLVWLFFIMDFIHSGKILLGRLKLKVCFDSACAYNFIGFQRKHTQTFSLNRLKFVWIFPKRLKFWWKLRVHENCLVWIVCT